MQNARLRVVELEHPGEEQGPHLAHGGAHRMARLPINIPQRNRGRFGGKGVQAHGIHALADLVVLFAGL